VQDAYSKRDIAIARANDLARELAYLREQMASAQDMSPTASKVRERRLSDAERNARERARSQVPDMNAELKTSKFRVSISRS
jgi:hypothetical protein